MLILSRNKKESILIGEDIEIEVLSMTRKEVFLGFKAPREISIHRKENKELLKLSQKQLKKKAV